MRNMQDYFVKVIMKDGENLPITVAMFLLETDAKKWMDEQNKEEDLYSIIKPVK